MQSIRVRLLVTAALAFLAAVVCQHFHLSATTTGLSLFAVGVVGIVPNDDTGKYLISLGVLDALGFPARQRELVKAKTADYTIVPAGDTNGVDGDGTIFTNRGAGGAVIFTLPAPAAKYAGLRYEFRGHANQTFTVGTSAGGAASFNNAACASVACSTGGQKIGACIRAWCDGTQWFLEGCTVGVTYTVA